MSWWPCRNRKRDKELREAQQKIAQLERDYRTLALTLQNLQSAIVAISRNQDTVVGDVRNIQEMVSTFLHEIDPTQLMLGFSSAKPGDDN